MKTLYAKCILYSYANLEQIMEQIDKLIEKKALESMNDFSPCITQCEKILNLTEQKGALITLKIICDNLFSKLSKYELDCLDYKYFRRHKKEYFIDFDCTSRGYFRRQIRLAIKVATRLEKLGITDDWFEDNCLSTDFFKELLKRVKQKEESFRKDNKVLLTARVKNYYEEQKKSA